VSGIVFSMIFFLSDIKISIMYLRGVPWADRVVNYLLCTYGEFRGPIEW